MTALILTAAAATVTLAAVAVIRHRETGMAAFVDDLTGGDQ